MKSYVFKQFVGIITLLLFAFIVDYYIRNVNMYIVNVQLINDLFCRISILLFVFNQLIYNYAKKNEDGFMQHKIWNKMFIVILIWLMISFVVFILLFFMTPLEDLIASYTWIMFIVVITFYFLLICLFYQLYI